MNISLTGLMGTGKSAVGRRLAHDYGFRFFDLDDIIVAQAGISVQNIFGNHGEAGFRRLESEAIERFVSGAYGGNCVLATGGGAVLKKSNRDLLRRWGKVILLTASVDETLKRVGDGESRPLLAGSDRATVIARLMAERNDAYMDCDFRIDTTGLSITEVAERIMAYLKSPRPAPPGAGS